MNSTPRAPLAAYELLDFGAGRKLERFGPWIIDRPCPVAQPLVPSQPDQWSQAHARFDRGAAASGQWIPPDVLPESWTIEMEVPGQGGSALESDAPARPTATSARTGAARIRLTLTLRPTSSGQVGFFPEQAGNWAWLVEQAHRLARPPRVLNLFAYTGGSTLALAAAGAQVVHVDAAESAVAWGRLNAQQSGLAARSVRWIVDDAAAFAARELRRGRRYDAIVLDPPSYGHGPRGQPWEIARHLTSLLQTCRELTRGGLEFLLLTCHTSGWEPAKLQAALCEAGFDVSPSRCEVSPMHLTTASARVLPMGICLKYGTNA
jgi:23S rRNA (cytosine1962-C5)-methyltransferase